jgi:hypothetical protein
MWQQTKIHTLTEAVTTTSKLGSFKLVSSSYKVLALNLFKLMCTIPDGRFASFPDSWPTYFIMFAC